MGHPRGIMCCKCNKSLGIVAFAIPMCLRCAKEVDEDGTYIVHFVK